MQQQKKIWSTRLLHIFVIIIYFAAVNSFNATKITVLLFQRLLDALRRKHYIYRENRNNNHIKNQTLEREFLYGKSDIPFDFS